MLASVIVDTTLIGLKFVLKVQMEMPQNRGGEAATEKGA